MGKVTRIISESEFARIEEVEDSSPNQPMTQPMTREELIEANQDYYLGLQRRLGKKTATQVFDEYIIEIMSFGETDSGDNRLVQVTRLK